MAKAENTTIKKVVETEEPAVLLTLTVREAEVLRRVLGGGVAGNVDGPRQHIDKIWAALTQVNVPYDYGITVMGITTVS